MDNDIIEYIKTKFLEVADIRKKILLSQTQKNYLKTDNKRSVKSLDEFIKDFKVLSNTPIIQKDTYTHCSK